jgi:elongation factor P--beta-lysine ligase
MALLKFNEVNLILNVECGALENYSPDEQVKTLIESVEVLKQQVIDFQKEQKILYQKFITEEIAPSIATIREEVKGINIKTYPELAKQE